MLEQDTDKLFRPEWTSNPVYRRHNAAHDHIEENRKREERRRAEAQRFVEERRSHADLAEARARLAFLVAVIAALPQSVPPSVRPEPKVAEIAALCAEAAGVSAREMRSHRRPQSIVRPRQIAMYLAKKLTSRSLPEIGRRFGGFDHSTVIHAVRKIEELLAADDPFVTKLVNTVTAELEARG